MPSTVVVGGFFGDEGKGKIISHLSIKDNPKIVVRGGAGPNAGHTIRDGDKIYKVRMLPSGFLNKKTKIMIGPGVVVNPNVLLQEISDFGVSGRSYVDRNCGIIEEDHMRRDSKGELKNKIGSTGSGTGPANADRAMRTLKLAKEIGSLSDLLTDVSSEINTCLDNDEKVLIEGTQGTFLSLWHGTYPYVTSKDVTASGICADVGLGPKRVNDVLVVFKSYVTRVGTGPLVDELEPEMTEKRGWAEFGTVTGRPRRAAEFNFDLARRAVTLNSATQLAITKLDIVYPDCAHKTSFEQLNEPAKSFIKKIEDKVGVPVTIIGTGPESKDVIDRRN
ncbi:MAG: adenylosuccinate synthetase [Nitrosopumilaceae archaeon]|nr:adenylosuccinate synthetase [Nitrosopumilaceae archaeon]NIT99485.1 adenylosuccinate synthetase [Nitrosopumilaceae archaeon]NIU85844.1 adenylosuccinate synthetase [Nitrosopumilaceae archaeon]NIV64701.1 adenylosuccinate synthetase [Nitrosopumilaceae archaeon]NIX60088.1 adenylosuccinate synthetase [Nitrosopumilaceae archaeon]